MAEILRRIFQLYCRQFRFLIAQQCNIDLHKRPETYFNGQLVLPEESLGNWAIASAKKDAMKESGSLKDVS
jgi:hypothetical protein